MKAITKYLLTAFAIANLMAIYSLFGGYADIVFYVTLGIGIITILANINKLFASETISTYKFIYIFIAVLWVYQFTFGWAHTYPKTWTYIISKTVMLLMTVIAIDRYPQYYLRRFYKTICYLTVVLVIIGIVTNSGVNDGGRLSCGFGNPNAAGTLCSICFSYILLSQNIKTSKIVKIIMMIVLLYAVLISGSRSSLGLIILAALYKYRFSYKLIAAIGFVSILLFVIFPHYNISFIGINRFSDTVEARDLSAGRELERKAAWLMIEKSPFEGNGIYCNQSEEARHISELGSHNAYLDFLKWFGYPIGLFLICSLFLCSIMLFKTFYTSKNTELQAHLIIVVGIIMMSFFEGFIWGVNQINNTLFFVSFAVLDYYRNNSINKKEWNIADRAI